MGSKKDDSNLDYPYLEKIQDIAFNPVFIIGVQRSGTSILYKILSQTNSFNIVTAYDIIDYNQLLYNKIKGLTKQSKKELSNLFNEKSIKSRGIDKLELNTDFAEEYGFVLAKESNSPVLSDQNIKIFDNLCKKIMFISDNSKPILLKNPHDSANFLYILSKYPNSRLIFIHRNPVRTLNSQLKAMRRLLDKRSEYMSLLSPGYKKVFEKKLLLKYYRFVYSSKTPLRVKKAISNLSDVSKYYLDNVKSIDKKLYFDVRYEDLCDNPSYVIDNIFDFLKIKPEKKVEYNKMIKPRKTSDLQEIIKREKEIKNKMKKYLKKFNYI